MEILKPNILKPALRRIGLYKPSLLTAGKPHGGKVKPYIAGHVTDGSSTFTFTVNGSDVTVSVSGGDWKYKPTAAITSLAFVGVPQLESLELNKITGVSTFNLDYPVVPVFKGCDATTENALNYVYHIRGTATEDFQFTLKYIDENNTQTTVTENAVIDENGKWDVSYSGKKIVNIKDTFKNNTIITSIEFTEPMDECTGDCSNAFRECTNIVTLDMPNAIMDKVKSIYVAFYKCTAATRINLPKATFDNVTDAQSAFNGCSAVTQLNLQSATFKKASGIYTFNGCSSLEVFDLSKATFESATSIQCMFENCSKLKTLDLSSVTIFATNTSNAFRNNTALENLTIKTCSTTLSFGGSSELTEQSVVNLFNAVAADGITLTFHATVFAMIQAQLDIEDSPIYNAYWNSDYDFTIISA